MLVTDDEIMAASAELGRPWQSVLPSIDLNAADSLAAAVARGMRSLRIRSLIDADASLGPGAAELVRAVQGELRALIYPAEAHRPRAPIGASVAVIESGDDWLLDVTTADGTHEIGALDDAAAAWRSVESLVRTAGDLPDDRVLTAAVSTRDTDSGVVVSIKGDEAVLSPLVGTADADSPPLSAGSVGDALASLRAAFES